MNGFALLAAAYFGLWLILLAPGIFVLARAPGPIPLPHDAVPDGRWARRLRADLRRRVSSVVDARSLPVTPLERRRFGRQRVRSVEQPTLGVRGSVRVPGESALACSIVAAGDVEADPGSVLLGSVVASGRVVLREGSRVQGDVVSGGTVVVDVGARVEGSVWAKGAVTLSQRARVDGSVGSDAEVCFEPASWAAAAYAPRVRGSRAVLPGGIRQPIDETAPDGARWTPALDAALEEEWPEGRLAEIADRLTERTGTRVRGVDVLARARERGLVARGLPVRPAVLGRKPAWLLAPEVVRVGADLQVPPGGVVSYSLVVEGALEVFEDAQLEAPVRSGRGLLMRAGSAAYGPVVSDGLVVCEEGSAVFGPIDSSSSVLLFANVRVGRPGTGACHALGYVGLEPGVVVHGPVVAGMGVRGEALRPREEARPSRRRRRRPPRQAASPDVAYESDTPDEPGLQEPPPHAGEPAAPSGARTPRRRGLVRRRSG